MLLWHQKEIEVKVRKKTKGDDTGIVAYENLDPDAMLSIPAPDHYLPLLYVLGLRRKNDRIEFPVQGVDGGSISMLAIRIG